jgi:hypothetical protein
MLTILWMFSLFILDLIIILSRRRYDWKTGLRESFLHFPLVVPLKNTISTWELCQIEILDLPVTSLNHIERIKMEAGKLSQNEAFL